MGSHLNCLDKNLNLAGVGFFAKLLFTHPPPPQPGWFQKISFLENKQQKTAFFCDNLCNIFQKENLPTMIFCNYFDVDTILSLWFFGGGAPPKPLWVPRQRQGFGHSWLFLAQIAEKKFDPKIGTQKVAP